MPSDNAFPLHEACREGQIIRVKELIDEQPKLTLTKDLDSRYPIHWAVSYQHEEIVNFLLSQMQTVDLDELLDDSGWSALHIASSVGNLNIITKLINHTIKPDVCLSTSRGITALHLACSKQHVSVAQLLIEEGASVRQKDSRNQLPLHRAASVGNVSLVELLCLHKSPVNTKDVQGWTPLFHALSEGRGDVAVILVKTYNAEYRDLKDVYGKTPLDVVADQKVKEYFMQNVE
ncbi:LANO_0F16314g1_1 [Lachancea nothofagi CBS 11611]|uniref:LANO_0F16314g1_1 n=1 Tax=Lachancea nothofagi CBS 11611 TaxID=1266666 RepID=A0A1G4KCV8_9SACH|nr:LANO_0F16314g1_1 [Lachancea nothofagi CBS 11611]